VNTVAAWAQAHGTYREVIPARTGEVFRPHNGTPALCLSVPCEQPAAYVAEIPNAVIRGGSESVWVNGEELNDLAVRHAGRMPVVSGLAPFSQQGSSYREEVYPTIEAGVMLTHQFVGNWFHWLVEQVTRLRLLDVQAPLLVDRDMPGQCFEALALFSGLPVIRLDRMHYNVRRLIVLSRLVWLPSDLLPSERVTADDILMAREAVDYLRTMRVSASPVEKLYVERRGAQRLANKDEIRGLMEARGYRTVHPEDLTFAQQRQLFGAASAVVGESGGGMTNVLFAPPECVVVVMQTPIDWNLFAGLVGFGRQRASFVSGTPANDPRKPYYQSPYSINAAALAAVIP
jgi:capsular polysaccharide biosynthesis protein